MTQCPLRARQVVRGLIRPPARIAPLLTLLYTNNLEQNAEKNVSTQSPAARQDAWLSNPHEDCRRKGCFVPPPCAGPQEAHRKLRKVVESQVSLKVFVSYAPMSSGECTTTAPVTRARCLPHFARGGWMRKVHRGLGSASHFRDRSAAPWCAIELKGVSARLSASGSIG